MLVVYESCEEVIICEVDSEGLEINVDQYFEEGTGRNKDEFDRTMVQQGPVWIRNKFRVEIDQYFAE